MNPLTEELRKVREKQGLTQADVARHIGLPQSHISRIEQGKSDIRLSTLLQLARILEHEPMLIPLHLVPFVKAIIADKKDIEFEPLWQVDEKEETE